MESQIVDLVLGSVWPFVVLFGLILSYKAAIKLQDKYLTHKERLQAQKEKGEQAGRDSLKDTRDQGETGSGRRLMGETFNIDKHAAGALLASTQQLRIFWTGVMTTHLTVALTLNVALWTYFLKGYFESSNLCGPYLLVVSGLSSILFGLWRWRSRRIDDYMASLYPDLLLYEGILGAPSSRSTSGFLIKQLHKKVPSLCSFLQCDQVSPKCKVDLISKLVKEKKIGDRGQKNIDIFALVIVIGITIASLLVGFSIYKCSWNFSSLWLIANFAGLFFLVWALTRYQKTPLDSYVQELIKRFKEHSPQGASPT